MRHLLGVACAAWVFSVNAMHLSTLVVPSRIFDVFAPIAEIGLAWILVFAIVFTFVRLRKQLRANEEMLRANEDSVSRKKCVLAD